MSLRRDTSRSREWGVKPRPRLRPKSAKQAKKDREYAKAREAVYERDGWCQAIERLDGHLCQGPLHVHHIRLRAQGGTHDLDNLILLCERSHTWAHANPAEAALFGLIERGAVGEPQ